MGAGSSAWILREGGARRERQETDEETDEEDRRDPRDQADWAVSIFRGSSTGGSGI